MRFLLITAFLKKSNLLEWKSRNIKQAILKWTIQVQLVHPQRCAATRSVQPEPFPVPFYSDAALQYLRR